MAVRGIGAPNILVIGDGNIKWQAPAQRSPLDRKYEDPLHDVRALARRSRKMLAVNDNIEKSAHAVYVVSDIEGKVTKIGRAYCPSSRLSRIQTGNPYELFLHRVFWVDRGRDAEELERRSHELAGSHGRLMGEWFACNVVQAHALIAKALDEMNIDYVAITPSTKGIQA
ncbi:GIY-YIG nuclease family protein [Agrobacterium sp. InxBP2]|uniref:GIY-YIG nuclease family protein n=1 Tax=Agrobacterium sp. InxBP2 TaxID=2870329 RepID=UPI00249EF8C2|nr:GIY-YIG nuclease family protein [Agrobacterium sp. InxBP2]MCW8279875.1 GIY-YIG nuclease family protein [Agrobacterium sp. InxBP2]